MIRTLCCLAFLAILPIDSSRASDLTLHDCIDFGLSRNINLQSRGLERTLNAPGARAAWGQFLPSVIIGYTADQSSFYNQTYLNPDGTVVILPVTLPNGDVIPVQSGRRRSSQLFVRVEEVLFDGGRNIMNLKNTKLQKELRDFQYSEAQSTLRVEIIRAYCQAIAANERLNLARQVLQQRRQQKKFADVRFNTGSVTRRDVLQAEIDWGRGNTDSLNAALEISETMKVLNALLDFPLDSTYSLQPLPKAFEPSWLAASLITDALSRRNDLQTASLNSRITHNDVLAEKGQYLPNLIANFTHARSEQSGANVGFTLEPRNRFSSLGLTLSWTLFDRFTRSLRIQDAKVKQQQADYHTFDLERQIRQEVMSTLDRLNILYQQIQVAEQNYELADETLKFEQERYRLGNASVIELGAAQVNYIQVRHDQINLATQFFTTLGELEQKTGMVLIPGDE